MFQKLFLIVALASTASWAQTRPQPSTQGNRADKERMESAKIGFISRELQLTPDEAKVFWPVYNAMEAEMKQANRDPLREGLKTVRGEGGIDNLSDAQARELLAELDKVGAEREAIRRKYQKEFLKVLPPQKVLKLHVAERKFKQEVMDRIRDAREGHPGPPPGGRPPGAGRPPKGPHQPELGARTTPLIFINGIESNIPLDAIAPDRIASVDVLKGDLAVATYGPRAQNGVVCVTLRTSDQL